MTNSELWSLSILGLLLAVALLVYILKQARLLKEVPSTVEESKASSLNAHLMGSKESLEVILKLVLDGQVEISEACMRIKVLLDHFDPSLHETKEFKVFSEVYDALAHMPTHQARKQTDKKFLFKLDQKRFEIERQHQSEVEQASRELLKIVSRPH